MVKTDTINDKTAPKITYLHWGIVVFAVLITYRQIFGAGFMSWDDAEYVLQNPDIRSFSTTNVSLWFRSFYVGNYHPLTIFSYAVDFLVGKQEPFMYHFTNILLHIANGLLVYSFVRKMQFGAGIALFTALMFALHPVQTESVSWIAERKNVLYGLFFLMALNIYMKYLGKPTTGQLILLFITGLAAMLSKATAVTLPVTLFAVDIWMGRSFKDRRLWLEKLPLVVLAIAVGLVAIRAQEQGQFLDVRAVNGMYEKLVLAGYAYVQYIVNLVFPYRLSVLYPYPTEIGAVHIAFMLLAIGIVALGIWAYRKKWLVLAGGIAFFTINMAPVLQFLQFGEMLMADRYLYIACIGVWLPVAYYLFLWLQRWQTSENPHGNPISALFSATTFAYNRTPLDKPRNTHLVVIGVTAVVLMFVTSSRNRIWLSEENFWRSVIEAYPNSSVAQNSVGGVYMNAGNYPEAIQYIDKAIALDADNYKAWYNKGVVHLRQGNMKAAMEALTRAISIEKYSKAMFTRAMVYQQVHEPVKALADIEYVIQEEPGNARAYFIKASAQMDMNSLPAAIQNYTKAIELESDEPLYYLRRGLAYATSRQNGLAMGDMNKAIELRPGDGIAWFYRALVKNEIGQSPCDDLKRASELGYKQAAQALSDLCRSR